jgi:hypothetical protein
MQITLPDGRKATVMNGNDKLSWIRLEDGREVLWPTKDIPQPEKEGEDTIKMVVVPAIDRLEEVQRYLKAVRVKINETETVCGTIIEVEPHDFIKLVEIEQELIKEVIQEAKEKWQLT